MNTYGRFDVTFEKGLGTVVWAGQGIFLPIKPLG